MAMLLYRVFYLPALLVALPYYLFRMWRRGGYRAGFANRFGRMAGVPDKRESVRRIWIQAVSVGELNALKPLLKRLQGDPGIEVVLTTTTSTGYRLMMDAFGGLTAWRGIFPIDFVSCSAAAWRRLSPDLAVLMEGELWPEHIHQAWRRRVPVLLVNARFSNRSFARHLKARGLSRPYFHKLTAILAGSESDRDRCHQLGWIPADRVHLAGNLKLDVESRPDLTVEEHGARIREFGYADAGTDPQSVRILLGSSTWPGEERALVDALNILRKDHPGLRLLLVPRHAERRKAIAEELGETGARYHFRTDARQAPAGTEVYVADTTGELSELTRCADVVFIGKSLPPNAGGQTPIEAAALGKPLVMGPEMGNFRDVAERLVKEDAARRIPHAGQLTGTIRDLLESEDARSAMGGRAAAFIAANRGATERVLRSLREHLA